MQHKAFNLEVKQAGAKTRTFCISCDVEDREGDILEPSGVVTDHYQKNPVVLWSHDYFRPPIGKTLGMEVTLDNRLTADVEFANTPFAQELKMLVDEGFLRSASVGFDPITWEDRTVQRGGYGRRYTKWELLEWSLVSVPSNPLALVVAAKSKGLHVPTLARVFNGKTEIITVNGLRVKLDYLDQMVREETRKAVERIRGQW